MHIHEAYREDWFYDNIYQGRGNVKVSSLLRDRNFYSNTFIASLFSQQFVFFKGYEIIALFM